MRKTTALTLLGFLAVLSAVATPLIVANASLPATEVERVKDSYYFRIHGQNLQNPDIGIAEFVYKNLSPITQEVVIIIGDGIPKGDFLLPGDPFSGDEICTSGQTVDFRVYINGIEEFVGSIWIPPNN
jgi:hypothetical protein